MCSSHIPIYELSMFYQLSMYLSYQKACTSSSIHHHHLFIIINSFIQIEKDCIEPLKLILLTLRMSVLLILVITFIITSTKIAQHHYNYHHNNYHNIIISTTEYEFVYHQTNSISPNYASFTEDNASCKTIIMLHNRFHVDSETLCIKLWTR